MKKSLGYIEKIKELLMNRNSLKAIEKENYKMNVKTISKSDNSVNKKSTSDTSILKRSISSNENIILRNI